MVVLEVPKIYQSIKKNTALMEVVFNGANDIFQTYTRHIDLNHKVVQNLPKLFQAILIPR